MVTEDKRCQQRRGYQEGTHGVVKSNGQDDEQVSNQCDVVSEEEEDEEEIFLFLLPADSQEDKLQCRGPVVFSHGSYLERGEESRVTSDFTVCHGFLYPPVLAYMTSHLYR